MGSCSYGILRPNIVMIGYKNSWFNYEDKDIQNYLNALKYTSIYIKG